MHMWHDNNIQTFKNVIPRFLDLEIYYDGIAFYKKSTNIGLCKLQ